MLTLVLTMTMGATSAQAGFGVSPSNIYHEYLKPGGHFEQKITLSRSEADENLEIVVEPTLEEMADWFTFDPGMKFTFPKGVNRISFTAIIDVPENATFKGYGGVIRVKAISADGPAGGVAIVKGARIDVELITTEINVTEVEVTQLKMRDVEGDDPLKLDIKATNKGNQDVSPEAKVTIMNLQMEDLETLQASNFGTIQPNKTEDLTAEFDTSLGTGEYFAQVSVLVNGAVVRQERLVFRISDRAETSKSSDIALQFNNITEFLHENIALKIFILLIILAILLVVAKKMNFLKWLKRKSLTLRIIISGLILVALLSLLRWVTLTNAVVVVETTETNVEQEAEKTNEEAAPQEESDVKGATTETPTESFQGDVQGAATEIQTDEAKAELPNSLLVVTAEDGQVVYPLYREASVTSQVVYYARSNDKFEVLEETSGWYRVILPNARGGWLPKESIKDAVVEER